MRATTVKHRLCKSGAVPHTAAKFDEFTAGGRTSAKATENFALAPGNPTPAATAARRNATKNDTFNNSVCPPTLADT